MGRFDNPSADKFDPPPGAERFEAPRPARRGGWIALALGAVYFGVEQVGRWWHPRGALALIAVIALSLLAALQFAARRKFETEQNPYSEQQRVTR